MSARVLRAGRSGAGSMETIFSIIMIWSLFLDHRENVLSTSAKRIPSGYIIFLTVLRSLTSGAPHGDTGGG
jgi:hypothetical protein